MCVEQTITPYYRNIPMKSFAFKWYSLFILNGLDLLLSYIVLTPKEEANPLAHYFWTTHGYTGVILFKVVSILIASCAILRMQSLGHEKHAHLALNIILCILFWVVLTLLWLFIDIYVYLPYLIDYKIGFTNFLVKYKIL